MEKKTMGLLAVPKQGRLCIYSEFFYGLCIGAWSIVLSFHLTACGVSEEEIGGLLSLGYLATAIVSFFVGQVGDRKGYPFVMALGAVMMSVALLLIAFSRVLFLFYFGHLLYCIGLACVMSMEFNLPLSLVPEEQQQYCYNLVLILYFLGSIAGGAACSAVFSMMKGREDAYRIILLLCAMVYVGLSAFRGRMPCINPRKLDTAGKSGIRKCLEERKIPWYLLYGFLSFGTFTLATGMLSLVLRIWHGISDSAVGSVFAANSVMGCIALMLLPALIHRFRLQNISKAALLIQFATFCLMTVMPTPFFILLLFCRTATCNILYTSVDGPMLRSISPEKRGAYAGMRVFANYAGMSTASVLSGWFVSNRLFAPMYLTCAGMARVLAVVYRFFCSPSLNE